MLRIIINVLILFFIVLIGYQLILANCSIVEGMKTSDPSQQKQSYKSYDSNNQSNALILAQQNAGNIGYINQQMDNVQNMRGEFLDLSNNVQVLQTQVNGLVDSQQQYASQLTGGSAPTITGSTSDGGDEDGGGEDGGGEDGGGEDGGDDDED